LSLFINFQSANLPQDPSFEFYAASENSIGLTYDEVSSPTTPISLNCSANARSVTNNPSKSATPRRRLPTSRALNFETTSFPPDRCQKFFKPQDTGEPEQVTNIFLQTNTMA
jgi:hypothetical protein